MESYGSDLKNLKMTRGDSANISVNGLSLVNGDTIYMTVKDNVNSDDKKFQKIVTSFTPEGNAIVFIEPTDTKGLNYKTYVYDIQLTRANGSVSTVVKPHEFKVESEVTFD